MSYRCELSFRAQPVPRLRDEGESRKLVLA